MANERSFTGLYENSFKKNWGRAALTDYRSGTLKYKELAAQIARLHIFYKECGIKKGDKISICGKNCSNWGVAFLSVFTYGAVAVPILNDFKEDNIHHIVNDSDSRMLFVGASNLSKLTAEEMPNLECILKLEDFSLHTSRSNAATTAHNELEEKFTTAHPAGFTPDDISYHKDSPDELAIINYTSGTSGFSKGVLIPYRALYSNMEFAINSVPLMPGDNVLSILPMAHMYGMSFEFLYELTRGVQVFFLTRTPSPRIIFDALSKVKPAIIVAVPLVIEKVIRKTIFPKLNTLPMRIATHTPILGNFIYKKICKQLIAAFGGNFKEIIIGGAAFSPDIDRFLHKIKFPYTVGYGATECAPIICYSDWKEAKVGSCGKPVVNMEVKIASNNHTKEAGEILCRGENVMLGYYKNPTATAEALDAEGWYHTGDLGVFDKEGFLYIKGRCKSMLLGANGQNIYPEEIEARLNNRPYIAESLVIQEGEKLIGLVYPDYDSIKQAGYNTNDLATLMEQNRVELNNQLPAYSRISTIRIQDKEFEKTPKKSIKRYLYQSTK